MINSTVNLEEMLDQVLPKSEDQKAQAAPAKKDTLDDLLGNDSVNYNVKDTVIAAPERQKLLAEIMEALDADKSINEKTVISECEDFNSLALFNTVTLLQEEYHIRPHAKELMAIETVGELIDYILNKIAQEQHK